MGKSLKGGEYERELSKTLSLWWTTNNPQHQEQPLDDCFWRTSQSGGRATTRAKKGKKADIQCSDICAIRPIGEPLLKVLLIESKRGYPKATLNLLIDKPDKKKTVDVDSYEEWFQTAERDRQRSGALYWAIIHRRDGREALIITQWGFIKHLPYKCILSLSLGGSCAHVDYEGQGLFCLQFKDFLRSIKPRDILTVLETKLETNNSKVGTQNVTTDDRKFEI